MAGETLSGIAQAELGDASRWPEIFAANRAVVRRFDRISPGMVLTLPTGPAPVLQLRFHLVAAGDTLSGIALKQLGDAARWPEIFALNGDVLSEPGRARRRPGAPAARPVAGDRPAPCGGSVQPRPGGTQPHPHPVQTSSGTAPAPGCPNMCNASSTAVASASCSAARAASWLCTAHRSTNTDTLDRSTHGSNGLLM